MNKILKLVIITLFTISIISQTHATYFHPYLREHRTSGTWNIHTNINTPIGSIHYNTNEQHSYNYRFRNKYININGNSETTSINAGTVLTIYHTPIRLEYHDRINHPGHSRNNYYHKHTPYWLKEKKIEQNTYTTNCDNHKTTTTKYYTTSSSHAFTSHINNNPAYTSQKEVYSRPEWVNKRNNVYLKANIKNRSALAYHNPSEPPSWINRKNHVYLKANIKNRPSFSKTEKTNLPEWTHKTKTKKGFRANINSTPQKSVKQNITRPSWTDKENRIGFRANIVNNPQYPEKQDNLSRPSWFNKT